MLNNKTIRVRGPLLSFAGAPAQVNHCNGYMQCMPWPGPAAGPGILRVPQSSDEKPEAFTTGPQRSSSDATIWVNSATDSPPSS